MAAKHRPPPPSRVGIAGLGATQGSLPSTARRPGSAPAIRGPWHNPKPSSGLRNPRSAQPGGIPLHKHPDVVFTPPDRQRAPPNGAQIRTPERRLERHTEWPSIVPSGTRGSEQFPHLDEAAKAAVETAQFLDRRVVHAPDGILDPCDLAPGRRDGPRRMHGTWGRVRIGPVPEDRPRPVKLSTGARDPDGLDRQPILPQGLPEPPVPVPPRMERRRGVVAGIGVDEHGAAGVQRHGHPAREVPPHAPGRAPVDPDGQQGAVDAERLERVHLLRLGREPGQARMLDHVVEREQAANDHLGRGDPAVADFFGTERPVDAARADPADFQAPDRLLGHQPLAPSRPE